MERNIISGAPPLNKYKFEFFKRRWLQTWLGGVELWIHEGGNISASVHLIQILLLLAPALIGIALNILVKYIELRLFVAQIISGAIGGLLVIITQIISKRRKSRIDAEIENSSQSNLLNNKNVSLSEEIEYDIDSLFSSQAVEFLFPTKTLGHLLFSIILSCFIWGFSVSYFQNFLIPSGKIGLYIFGWITVCVGQFSLLSRTPPEPSQYRGYDRLGILTFSRGIYISLFFIFHLIQTSKTLNDIDFILHIVFVFLTPLWSFGIIPQIDCLLLWVMELVVVFVFGGTPTLNDVRLTISFLFACGAFAVTLVLRIFVNNIPIYIGSAAMFGYLLSRNLLPLENKALSFMKIINIKGVSKKITVLKLIVDFLFSLCIGGIAYGLTVIAKENDFREIEMPWKITMTVLFAILFILSEIQQPFFCNLVKNVIYIRENPKTNRDSKGRVLKGLQTIFYWIFSIIPLIILIYISFFVIPQDNLSDFEKLIECLLLVRAHRWIWQSTHRALFEVLFIIWLQEILGSSVFTPQTSTQLPNLQLGLTFQLFIAAIAHDRIIQLIGKLHFVLISIISSITYRKLVFPYSKLIHTLQLTLFIWILIFVLLVSSIFGSPIIPFLGLPVFVIGFPRVSRHWPITGASFSQTTEDTVFYKQIFPRLMSEMSQLMDTGFFLNSFEVGSFLLVRFETLLIWIEIVERGYGYNILVVKGLEMQGTSCHHQEAGEIDQLFADSNGEGVSPKKLNENFFHAMRPLGYCNIFTHRKSRVNFTGIIDHPDHLKLMSATFYKCLIWILHTESQQEGKISLEGLKRWKTTAIDYIDSEITDDFPSDWLALITGKANSTPMIELDPIASVSMTCFNIVERYGLSRLGNDIVAAGPKHIFDVFCGKIPYSLEAEWIEHEKDLKNIVINAYRIAFKLLVDQVTIMGSEYSMEELQIALEETHKEWYIGPEKLSTEWQDQILRERNNLFSLNYNPNERVYFGHLLKLSSNSFQFGMLSRESIRSMWANLNLELLYITNDDDERYSIQAHQTLLRNITIQSSEPPLGYPVWSSIYGI